LIESSITLLVVGGTVHQFAVVGGTVHQFAVVGGIVQLYLIIHIYYYKQNGCLIIEGRMEKLDNNWILKDGGKSSECPVEFSAPATLGLTNMAGLYQPPQTDGRFHQPPTK
jgi:hypothetical protein